MTNMDTHINFGPEYISLSLQASTQEKKSTLKISDQNNNEVELEIKEAAQSKYPFLKAIADKLSSLRWTKLFIPDPSSDTMKEIFVKKSSLKSELKKLQSKEETDQSEISQKTEVTALEIFLKTNKFIKEANKKFGLTPQEAFEISTVISKNIYNMSNEQIEESQHNHLEYQLLSNRNISLVVDSTSENSKHPTLRINKILQQSNEYHKGLTKEIDLTSGKILIKREDNESDEKSLEKERQDLEGYKGDPHIVQIKKNEKTSFHEEYMNQGSLETFIKTKHKNGISDPKLRKSLMVQALQGINSVHAKGNVHINIDTGNILLNQDSKKGLTLKIGGFGYQRTSGQTDGYPRLVSSPDSVKCKFQNMQNYQANQKDDMFALGSVLYNLKYGHSPEIVGKVDNFHDQFRDDALERNKENDLNSSGTILSAFPVKSLLSTIESNMNAYETQCKATSQIAYPEFHSYQSIDVSDPKLRTSLKQFIFDNGIIIDEIAINFFINAYDEYTKGDEAIISYILARIELANEMQNLKQELSKTNDPEVKLILSLLQGDPNERPTASEALKIAKKLRA